MRLTAALIAGAVTACAIPGLALAASDALVDAAFSERAAAFQPASLDFSETAAVSAVRYAPGEGLMRWTTGEVASFARPGAAYTDSVRVSTMGLDANPGMTLMRPGAFTGAAGAQAYDVTYLRRWPAMFAVNNGRLSFDITPHAGLGFSSGGGRSAEAGVLARMARVVGDAVGAAPHWYVYAGYRKRAVGLNLMRGDEALRRDRLIDDGFARQVQAGLGAQRGRLHALIGYTREEVTMRALGDQQRGDDRVGLNFSIR